MGGGVLLPVKEVSYKDEEVIIKTSGESLPKEFFRGMEGASCRLKITDGINNVSSSFFSLTPDNTAGGFFFKIQDLKGNYYEPFLVEDNIIHVSIPKGVNLSALYPIFMGQDIFMSSLGFEITGKQAFDFSDFTKPFTFRQITKEGAETQWAVNIYDLPVFLMETPNRQPIESKEERVNGTEIKIIDGNTTSSLGTAGVKGRGSSSWAQPKKPYNIKLDKKKEVLGMSSNKNWVLLANCYYDRTQLHNATGLQIARLTDYDWVPECRYVELFLNGKHRGLYLLTEKIDEGTSKIKIEKGGYLLESTIHEEDENIFATSYFNKTGASYAYNLYWEQKYPDGLSEEVVSDLNYTESVLFSNANIANGDYNNYLDVESTINWWLVEALVLNEESMRTKNMFLYKTNKTSKLKIGPPWDFDYSTFGLTGVKKLYVGVSVKTTVSYTWCYPQLFKDPQFVLKLINKFNIYKNRWKVDIPNYIDEQFSYIKNAALRNDIMWPDFDPTNFKYNSYNESVEDMKASYLIQLNWMDEYINSFMYKSLFGE